MFISLINAYNAELQDLLLKTISIKIKKKNKHLKHTKTIYLWKWRTKSPINGLNISNLWNDHKVWSGYLSLTWGMQQPWYPYFCANIAWWVCSTFILDLSILNFRDISIKMLRWEAYSLQAGHIVQTPRPTWLCHISKTIL